MRSGLQATAGFVALALATAAALETSAGAVASDLLVAERPTWKAGDAWQYETLTTRTGAKRKWWWTVTGVRPGGGYQVTIGVRDQERDADFNTMSAQGGEVPGAWFRWPVRAGDRWSYDVPIAMDAGNGTSSTKREVVGIEKVDVPAGSFDCLRIESSVTRMTYDARQMSRPGYSSSIDRTDWYCPSLRNFAKRVDVWRDGYGGMQRDEVVLLHFHLAD